MGPGSKLHLAVHPGDDVGQAGDGVEDVPRHGEVVIVAPVQRHWAGHLCQTVLGHRPLVVGEILLVAPPVVAVEPALRLLLPRQSRLQ